LVAPDHTIKLIAGNKKIKVTSEEIKEMFSRFSEMNIMIIGDVMIDSYMWGRVERISPEAPIPIVTISKRENRLGGAANVALNIQSLGARPLLCSIIGNDERKGLFMDLLRDRNMDTSGIMLSDDRVTTVKTRIIGSNQQLLRVDEENGDSVTEETALEFIAMVDSLMSKFKIDAVIFEDYDKGVITPSIIKKTIALAKEKGIIVTADPKKRNFCSYNGIDLFTPNLKEVADGLRIDNPRGNITAIEKAAIELQELQNISCLLVTLAEMGIYLRYENKGSHIPAEIRDIADVSGAGDTVISVATTCLVAGAGPVNTTIVANLAGGLVCEKVGVVPINKKLLLHETLELFNRKQPSQGPVSSNSLP
jgi:D-glycero-beta-D-manno-heptose-7-phosphate kinase